jgi:hypothetical protein
MLKIMRDKWDKNKGLLEEALAKRSDLNECKYDLLVKLAFQYIYNADAEGYAEKLNLNRITVIDDGDYQGTLLYLIPFESHQPAEYENLMTHVDYGSCSGCDTLQAIQSWREGKLTPQQLKDFMSLCKDIICNTIKPYNSGWRGDEDFKQIEEE